MPAIEALLNCRGRGPLLQRMAVHGSHAACGIDR
jgi:hypothetical protein